MKLKNKNSINVILLLLMVVIGLIIPISFYTYVNTSPVIKVGIMDSGYPHPGYIPYPDYDMDEYFGAAKSFITIDNNYAYDDDNIYDLLGHGNAVISTLISHTDANLKIYSAKILDLQGVGTIDAFIAAEEWLVSQDVDLVMLSIGALPRVEIEEMGLFNMFKHNNILTIISSGNYANGFTQNSVGMPAYLDYENMIVVGASYDGEAKAYFSSSGLNYNGFSVVDVVEDPYAYSFDGVRDNSQGTSFAVPKIAATFCDFLSHLNFDLSITQIKALMFTSTGSSFTTLMGFGIPDDVEMIRLLELDEPLITIKHYDGYPFSESYYRVMNENFSITYDFELFTPLSQTSLNINVTATYEGVRRIYDVQVKYSEFTLFFHNVDTRAVFNYSVSLTVLDTIYEFYDYINYYSATNRSLYVDYSGLNDLRFSEYGVMTRQMNIFRANGVKTFEEGRQITRTLTEYDYVLSPMYEDRWFEGYERYVSEQYAIPFDFYYHNSTVETLLEYVAKGGFWILSSGVFDYFTKSRGQVRLHSLYQELGVELYLPSIKGYNGDVNSYGVESIFGVNGRSIYHPNYGLGIEILNSSTVIPVMGTDEDMLTAVLISYGEGKILLMGDVSPFIYNNDPFLILDILSYL